VLRGLHFQWPNPQGKLVYVLQGEVYDVAVDVRPDSPTFRRWVGHRLSAANRTQLWIPPGYAHGFCVVSDGALFAYKCTTPYDASSELVIRWDDPDLAIDWPVRAPLLSRKDEEAPRLAAIDPARLPR
jgi:dTDP-4-dehydrorhamnose 3,5-epimerase